MKKLLVLIILALLLIAEGLGCGWSRFDTVRYNTVRNIADFAYIPRPKDEKYFLNRRNFSSGDRFGYNDNIDEFYEPQEKPPVTKVQSSPDTLFKTAVALEAQGKYQEALEVYRKSYLAGEKLDAVYQINGLLDRIDLFSSDAVTSPRLKQYLEIRDAFDSARSNQERNVDSYGYYVPKEIIANFCVKEEKRLQQLLQEANVEPLKDNVKYLLAAIKYAKNDFDGAIKDLNELVKLFPKSEKLAAAHFLLGKCYYQKHEPLNAFYYEVTSGEVKGVLEGLRNAVVHFTRAVEFDRQKLLLPECYGWRGGAQWRLDQPLASLESFVQAFLLEKRNPDRWLKELPFAYGIIRAEQEEKALEIVSADPRLLLSYVWYGIYHHPDDPARQALLAKAAKAYLDKNPKVELAGSLALRIAQALYGAKDYKAAIQMTEQLKDPLLADQALWMRAVSNAELKNFDLAIADLKKS
ncbi:MAG: tetratricopeptide repeat protein [Acidobacteriota bacterium]|nr:tetratricopeptide repeat protein [Blastocatellia bacterium]MDW8413372.1 tetratricopeptide repeat protein [Acidobacteriota bacterium]